MRLNTILIVTALTASVIWGQNPTADTTPQQTPNHEGYVAQVIHVKTLTGDSFSRLTNMLLNVFKTGITGDANLRTIVVYGPKDVVTQVEKVVAELDTPGSEAAIGRNVEMTMTLLQCSTKEGTGAKLPSDIEPVAKQLRAATQYKDIRVWDVIPLRLQEGKQSTEEMTLPTGTERPATFSIEITPEAATRKGEIWSVRFSRFNLDFAIPMVVGGNTNFQHVGLRTAGDFQEGQKTVLGKVSGLDSDSAIFVVISLKVLE
jgi:hypothetical protein